MSTDKLKPGNEIVLPSLQSFLKAKWLQYPQELQKGDTYSVLKWMLVSPIYNGQHPRIKNWIEFSGDNIFWIHPAGDRWVIADAYLGQGVGTITINQGELFDLSKPHLDYMAQFMPWDNLEERRLLFFQFCESHFGVWLLRNSQVRKASQEGVQKQF